MPIVPACVHWDGSPLHTWHSVGRVVLRSSCVDVYLDKWANKCGKEMPSVQKAGKKSALNAYLLKMVIQNTHHYLSSTHGPPHWLLQQRSALHTGISDWRIVETVTPLDPCTHNKHGLYKVITQRIGYAYTVYSKLCTPLEPLTF